ncbi:MAG: FliM/FliN family flagellar motor C-terminal domain-containing protein [Pirellulales bacterium]
MPEHAGCDGRSDWTPLVNSSATAPRSRTHDVASEIDRLLSAAREALQHGNSSVDGESNSGEQEDSTESPAFAWPTWEAAVSQTRPANPVAAQNSTVQVVVGKMVLAPEQLSAFRSGDPFRLLPLTTHDLEKTLVEVRVDGRPYARGTLVNHEGRFAVRITEVMTGAASMLPIAAPHSLASPTPEHAAFASHSADRSTQEVHP